MRVRVVVPRPFRAALIAAILLSAVSSVPSHAVAASADWYDSNWTNRTPIFVDNTAGAVLTDYQVEITVSYEGVMQADFDDLRFTAGDGVTILDYWIQEKTDSSQALVWVEVPSIPASDTTTVYMYYGNPSAVSTASGEDTFLFFYDFGAEDSLDTNEWEETRTGATLDWSSDDYVDVSSSGNDVPWQIRTINAESTAFVAEFKLNIISFDGSASFWNRVADESNIGVGDPVTWGYYCISGAFRDGLLSTGVRWFKVVLDSSGWDTDSRTPSAPSWADWSSANWAASQDALKSTLYHNCGTTACPASLHQRWYYYFHRQYADPEPSVTFGQEINLALSAGWNMVSVPLELADASRATVFPPADVVAVYTWNPVTKSYEVPTDIAPEVGYWVAVTEDKTITVTGTPVTTWSYPLTTGWNMVGSVCGNAVSVNDFNAFAVAPSGSVLTSAIYWWNPVSKSYETAPSIVEGQGYWAATTQNCNLTMTAPTPP